MNVYKFHFQPTAHLLFLSLTFFLHHFVNSIQLPLGAYLRPLLLQVQEQEGQKEPQQTLQGKAVLMRLAKLRM